MYRLREEKEELRKKYLEIRRNIDPSLKESMDRKIFTLFTSLISYRYSDTLLLYYPTRGEVDTLPIICAALESGKRVALPVCRENEPRMDYYYISSESDLTRGKFGIPAPRPDLERFDKNGSHKGIVVVVPALAFDRAGYRLGYGKGYYDRFINELSATSIGLIYSSFVANRLPRGRYDLSVDLLVTEKGVRLIENNK